MTLFLFPLFFFIGMSSLHALRLCALHHNNLYLFPRQLHLCKKLVHLNVSSNIRLRGKYVNIQKHDASIDYRRDLVPMATMFRLLRDATGSSNDLPLPPPLFNLTPVISHSFSAQTNWTLRQLLQGLTSIPRALKQPTNTPKKTMQKKPSKKQNEKQKR